MNTSLQCLGPWYYIGWIVLGITVISIAGFGFALLAMLRDKK